MRTLDYAVYQDKIKGAWIGKSLGGTIGAPVEGHKCFMHFTEADCWPEEIMPNDDLDIQIVWLEMLQAEGPFVTSETLARWWQTRCWYNFAEYGVFLYNYQRGLKPPLSGSFDNLFFSESMGCPIRSEIWGVICPGNPELAAAYAKLDGQLDHVRESVYAEQFLAAAEAEAFFAATPEECLEAGLEVIPPDCELARLTREVELLCAKYDSIPSLWRALVRRWGHRDASKALINQAFIQAALRKGKGDFGKTLLLALNFGWDTDCTAATAGALLGLLAGADNLPQLWLERAGERLDCNVNVEHKTATFDEVAADTALVGAEIAAARNHRVQLLGAPKVEVRGPKHQPVELEVNYLSAPVLWRSQPTEIEVTVTAVQRSEEGTLALEVPPGTVASPAQMDLTLPAGTTQRVHFNLLRAPDAERLADKNLFKLTWHGKSQAEATFGLVGARQWRIYGPYWDLHDVEKFGEENPFHNDHLKRNPHLVPGCHFSGTHQFVYLDRPYLDEARLLRGPLPEEEPLLLESGEDYFDQDDLGGFLGEACYYFTRLVVPPFEGDWNWWAACTGPFKLWLNGEEVFRFEKALAWTPMDHNFVLHLTEGANRLVVKALRLADTFRFSLMPMHPDAGKDKTKGLSYIDDRFSDYLE